MAGWVGCRTVYYAILPPSPGTELPHMQIGPMLAALPELLPLSWKYDRAGVSRVQARKIIRSLAPGAVVPQAGWEICLVAEAAKDGFWVLDIHLVNQASPRNLEFILGMTSCKSPLYLELRW